MVRNAGLGKVVSVATPGAAIQFYERLRGMLTKPPILAAILSDSITRFSHARRLNGDVSDNLQMSKERKESGRCELQITAAILPHLLPLTSPDVAFVPGARGCAAWPKMMCR